MSSSAKTVTDGQATERKAQVAHTGFYTTDGQVITESKATIVANNCTVKGDDCMVDGNSNTISGKRATVFGNCNIIEKDAIGATVDGFGNVIFANDTMILGGSRNILCGEGKASPRARSRSPPRRRREAKENKQRRSSRSRSPPARNSGETLVGRLVFPAVMGLDVAAMMALMGAHNSIHEQMVEALQQSTFDSETRRRPPVRVRGMEQLVNRSETADEEDKKTESSQENKSTSSTTASKDAKEAEVPKEHQCSICMDKRVSVLTMPCAHMSMCDGCATELFKQGDDKCPICKKKIEQVMTSVPTKVFVAGRKA